MTRAGALLWKEWRDHRAALAVFAALVPLLSWPTQKYMLKFSEPSWTWNVVVPVLVAPCVAVVAADAFAMDLATSRMTGFAALPVPLARHFSIRTLFLALVGIGIAVWSGAVNVAIATMSPKAGYAAQMLDAIEPSAAGFAGIAAVMAGVLVLSALGVGGFRAAIGGALLAGIAYFATDYAADVLFPQRPSVAWRHDWPAWKGCASAAVLGVAAFAGFARSRALPQLRRRGVVAAAAILVGAFGLPASAATWATYRGYTIRADDEDASINSMCVSPDGRHVAVVLQKNRNNAGYRSWIVRTDGTAVFDWPRRNDYVAGWSNDGLAWVGRVTESHKEDDFGSLVQPETGDVVTPATKEEMETREVRGWTVVCPWARWLRWDYASHDVKDVGGVRMYEWKLWVKDTKSERSVLARSMPAPTPKVGEILFITADEKLCLLDLAGGEPRVVAEHVRDISGWLSGSPDGRYYVVGTAGGRAVLDSATWQTVAGPFGKDDVVWCSGSDSRAVLCVIADGRTLGQLRDVGAGRWIPVDPSLDLAAGYGGIHALDDATLVARSGDRGVVVLDADGKLVRRLFPPKGN